MDIEGTGEGMEDKKPTHEEWLAAERARLKKGFTYEPQPSAAGQASGGVDQLAAGLGLGAGVVAGAVGPHPNPTTFEGVRAAVIADALRAEIPDTDTQVRVDETESSMIVNILKSQEDDPYQFLPALSVTLIEAADVLTITVSELHQSTVRNRLSSIGGTVLEQAREVLSAGRRRGLGGLLDMAGRVKDGLEELVEDVQDLSMPRRVWSAIDRVGQAAEQAHLEERRQARATEWKREAAERAWTHCHWCGRAYAEGEAGLAGCPSCGAPRGARPASPS